MNRKSHTSHTSTCKPHMNYLHFQFATQTSKSDTEQFNVTYKHIYAHNLSHTYPAIFNHRVKGLLIQTFQSSLNQNIPSITHYNSVPMSLMNEFKIILLPQPVSVQWVLNKIKQIVVMFSPYTPTSDEDDLMDDEWLHFL